QYANPIILLFSLAINPNELVSLRNPFKLSISKTILSFIKEYSKEIGCSEMFLITDKGNPRACHVYEKLGGKNDYKDEIVYVYDYEKGDK
ncbi:GNAT family N-acetyltransferase, partial [Staphylococcus aureus]|uniref:GNAT family N-acetyltransferase n=1 Tax=Staphylococcus aureus TaxID=1280 RepID=UPI0021AC1F14